MSGYSAWLVLYSAGFIALYCLGVRMFSLVSVQAVRQISHYRFLEGEEVIVSLTINQRSYMPLAWVVIQDEWMHNGSRQMYHHRRMFIPWVRSTFNYSYRITGIPRGKYVFHKIKLFTGDIFGFFRMGKQVELPVDIMVYPRPLSSFRLFGDGLYYGERALKAMLQKNAIQVSSVRDYMNGDALNRIHWKMSSRSNELKTKEMESSTEDRIVIVLNAALPLDQELIVRHLDDQSVKDEQLDDLPLAGKLHMVSLQYINAFEKCVQAAAGLLKYGKANQCRMALVCNSNNGDITRLASRTEMANSHEFLAEVVNQGTIPFTTLLQEEINALPSGTAIVCITPDLDVSWIDVLHALNRRRVTLQIIYVTGSTVLTEQEMLLIKQLERTGCSSLHIISGVSDRPKRVEVEDIGA